MVLEVAERGVESYRTDAIKNKESPKSSLQKVENYDIGAKRPKFLPKGGFSGG